jgi:putative ABC transport system permease protein
MGLWSRFRRTWRDDASHAEEIREELQFHLDMDAAGEGPRQARVRFGNVARIEEDTRAAGLIEWLDSCLRDLGFAVRYLRSRPGFTLVAVSTLAVGIGATTAIFAAVNAVLIRPLPYPDPGHVYSLGTLLTDGRYSSGRVAMVEATRLNALAPAVAAAAVVQRNDVVVLKADGTPVPAVLFSVSRRFFDIAGMSMFAGRAFTDDDHAPEGPQRAIVSYRFWRDRLGSDRGIVGHTIHLTGGAAPVVIGVAPEGSDIPPGADIWINMRVTPEGTARSFTGYLRARPGTTRERLDSELASVMSGLAQANPTLAKGRVFTLRPLVDFVVGDLGPILVIVLSGAAVLLVLGCVNVANLLLARGAARTREMALRTALGASRGRIARQLMSEALVLAAAGGLAGFAVAWAGVRVLHNVGVAHLPRLDVIPLDWRILAFAGALLAGVTLLVGLAPAARLARADVQALLADGGRSASSSRGATRVLNALVAVEISLAVALIAGSGWVVRGYTNVTSAQTGFVAEGRLVFDMLLPQNRYRTPESVTGWFSDLSSRLRAVHGVTSVGAASSFPLRPDWDEYFYVAVQGDVFDASRPMTGRLRRITPAFLSTLGVPLLAGREFTTDDRRGTGPVAIVNRSFRDRYLHGRDPLATRFSFGFPNPGSTVYTIVGVSEDVRHVSPTEPAEPSFYIPQAQSPAFRQTVVVSTTVADPAALIPDIRRAVREIDPDTPATIELLSDNLSVALSRQRLGLVLMALFATTALALAAIGIYGVISYGATLRLREIATRLALGASRPQVFLMLLRQGGRLAAIGLATGLLLALALGRIVTARLYEVHIADPRVLALAVALVAVISAGAIVLPAGRAAGIDSARYLRAE